MWLLLIQLALVLAWYLVPSFAAVSAWVIFLPIIVALLVVAFWVIFFGGLAGLMVWLER